MERLTERLDGWVMRKGCHGPCRTCDGAGCADIHPMIDRLAAYEDTGLEPEEVKEHEAAYIEIMTRTYGPLHQKISQWIKAEKDGRLVVLPCKVGDTVYRVITTRDNDPIITEIEIKNLGQAADLIGRIGKKQVFVSWYKTREEAEAALKKGEEAT